MTSQYYNDLMWKYLMKRGESKEEASKVLTVVNEASPFYDFRELFKREEAHILKDWATYPEGHVSEWIIEFLEAVIYQADFINLEGRLIHLSHLLQSNKEALEVLKQEE